MFVRELDERFSAPSLNREIWFPYYLPHWSSRAESAATYRIGAGGLELSIPEDQPLWCPDRHDEPLRVSCVQTGSFSGPVGSTIGQQPFKEGLTVTEEQPEMWGYTPMFGSIEVTMRGLVGPDSMFAFWMSGIEDVPERSGEICVAEIFGADVGIGAAEIGIGVHAFRDPTLREEFSTIPVDIDVSEYHSYGVRWAAGALTFTIDGEEVRRSRQSPQYPMQLMIGVFDFPGNAGDDSMAHVPRMWVSRVTGKQETGGP